MEIFKQINLKMIIRILWITLFIVYIPMVYYFNISIPSEYAVSITDSQLSFSSEFIKAEYLNLIIHGNYSAYRTAQIIDFGFMISYGLLIYFISLSQINKISKHEKINKKWMKTGKISAYFGLGALFCDMIENTLILMMLQDPMYFPGIWAIIHSTFALIKYILLYSSLIWIILAKITLYKHSKSN